MANTTYRDFQDRVLDLISKNDSTTRNRIKNWLNLGYQDFVLRELWPFREVTGSLNTVQGTQEYDLSSNFTDIDEQNIISVALQGTVSQKLPYIPYNQLRLKEPDFDLIGTDVPRYYYIKSGSIGFWPSPSDVYVVTVDYYKVPTEMSTDTDVPIIPLGYREALVQYALSMEHDFNSDPDLAVKAMNTYENKVTLARQNLLSQPVDTGNFRILGPADFKNHTGLYNEIR